MRYMLRFVFLALVFSGAAHAYDTPCYAENNPEKNIKNGIANCREKINHGDDKSALDLAALLTGLKRFEEAKNILLKYRESTNSEALHMLGVMYEKGYAVEVDYIEAMKWYTKGHDLGNSSRVFKILCQSNSLIG